MKPVALILALLAGRGAAALPPIQALVPVGRQPRVAIDAAGRLAAITYGIAGTIYCITSEDGGATWATPVKVGALDKLALGMRRGPQVAVGGGRIAVLAISHETGNVLAWTSTTAGRTWSAPATVNDSPKSAEEGLHAVTAAPDGTLFAVWLDHRNGKGQALAGSVLAQGASVWTANSTVYESPDGHICECCHPFATSDADGDFFVAWRNMIKGSRDLYLAVSRDRGRTFADVRKLGNGTWKIEGCPMAGPWVAAASPDQVVTVWPRMDKVYRCVPEMPETSLGTGKQPAVALAFGGEILIMNNGDALKVYSPTSDVPELIGPGAYPAIASTPDGRGPVIAVWESRSDPSGVSGMVWGREGAY